MITFLIIWLTPSILLLASSYIKDVWLGYEIQLTTEDIIINIIFILGGLFTLFMCIVFGLILILNKIKLPSIPDSWSEVKYTFNKRTKN